MVTFTPMYLQAKSFRRCSSHSYIRPGQRAYYELIAASARDVMSQLVTLLKSNISSEYLTDECGNSPSASTKKKGEYNGQLSS